ncbi:MAG: outer membrane protein [Pseudohongiellaceae bacterium]
MESSNKVISKHQNRRSIFIATSLATSLFFGSTALAQDFYVSGSVGINDQQNSNSSGNFVNNFTTGQVTGFTSPVSFASGTPFSWETDFSDGETYSIAFGYTYNQFRFELAHHRSSNNVSGQSDLTVGATDLSSVDAGVLLTGNTNDIGVSSDLFLSGGGRMDTTTVMLNAYYDFDFGGDLNPYVGVGIGNAEEDVLFTTQSGNLLRDKDNGFAWQLIGGVEYQATPTVSFFGQYRYFRANDPTLGLKLLPGSVDVENQFQAFEVGLRYSF